MTSTGIVLPNDVSAMVNNSPSNLLERAAATAAKLLKTEELNKKNPENFVLDDPTANSAVDAVLSVFIEARRRGVDDQSLVETLASAVPLAIRSEKAEILAAHYTLVLPPVQPSFLPALTGVEWSLQHELGDRTQDPPSRSLPQLQFVFHTMASGPQGGPGQVSVQCTAEQAQDLLEKMRDMVKEAERVAAGSKQF